MHRTSNHEARPATSRPAGTTMAVMVTDVVESTRLRANVGDDEATRLLLVVSSIVRNAVAGHGGTVRRRTGDGDRSTFPSVRAALRAAATIQGLLARRPVAGTGELPVRLRIGVCVGEVSIDPSGDVIGPSVAAAARVAATAPTGGVAVCPIAATMDDGGAPLRSVATVDGVRLFEPSGNDAPGLPGRAPEFDRVQTALDTLAQGHGGVLLVSGAVGSGRSRLLEETAKAAAARGLRTLQHHCTIGEPLHGTLTGLLDDALARVDPETIREAVGDDADTLVALLPELALLLAGSAGRRAPADRAHAERALMRFLARAAAARPLLLLIDDFDLADTASREVVCRLAPRLAELGVLVVASMRENDAASSWEAWRDVAGLVRSGHAHNVTLGPLGDEGIRDLLALLLPDAPTSDQVEAVRKRTGGNLAAIRALALEAVRLRVNVTDVSPPDSVVIPLRATLDLLEPAGRQVAELLAVLGKATTLALLVAFVDHREDEILAAIEQAEHLGILRVVEISDELRVWFHHGLVRDVLLADTGGITRTRWAHRGEHIEHVV